MLARLANRRSRLWAAALALVLNLGGGPMAWAHLASGGGHCHTAAPSRADCPEHSLSAAHEHAQPAQSLPCCDGGGCTCATPPAPASMSLAAPLPLPFHASLTAAPPPLHAPDPLADSLRPPIR